MTLPPTFVGAPAFAFLKRMRGGTHPFGWFALVVKTLLIFNTILRSLRRKHLSEAGSLKRCQIFASKKRIAYFLIKAKKKLKIVDFLKALSL